jgi:hypothetical protein
MVGDFVLRQAVRTRLAFAHGISRIADIAAQTAPTSRGRLAS